MLNCWMEGLLTCKRLPKIRIYIDFIYFEIRNKSLHGSDDCTSSILAAMYY